MSMERADREIAPKLRPLAANYKLTSFVKSSPLLAVGEERNCDIMFKVSSFLILGLSERSAIRWRTRAVHGDEDVDQRILVEVS
ncbi:hypothetical protein AVEN_135874-1 [Araneus ventricosus]|uniref:Uncharacterized protein n=1 Tax=Araneus ventricosus TaxID=182803 RepID=A0A4Y2J569_ARAVE|nr:hypothetical protein AVEN_135874-1 [Araneus ventricosus]